MRKTCTKCGKTKQLTEFYKSTEGKHGHHSQCKACFAIRRAKQYAATKEQVLVYNAKWVKENRDKNLASQARYREKHREKINAKTRQWKRENKERCAATNALYRLQNKEKCREYAIRYHKENPEKRAAWQAANPEKRKAARSKWSAANPEACRIYIQNRRSRKLKSGGNLSKGLAAKLFELQRGKCACGCKQQLGDGYHMDHIIPLALGGSNTDDNIQLLRAECNQKKGAKHPVDFMQSRGFLL